jgi:gliding motility-associated lipoprotein GldH
MLASCKEEKAIINQYQFIDDCLWNKHDTYYFSVEITDISTPYNIYLNIRNTTLYPYQNAWITYAMEQPIGALERKKIECVLTDKQNRWLGSGISLFQNKFSLKESYTFAHKGTHTFSFKHLMQDSTLHGIQEIGLEIIPTPTN